MRISVIVPTREPARAAAVLTSLAGQRGLAHDEYEVLIVADGDRATPRLLGGRRWPFRLRVLTQPHSGSAAARNLGWREAGAPHVLFLDDGLEATPGLLEEHLVAAGRHPGAAVLGRIAAGPGASALAAYQAAVRDHRFAEYVAGRAVNGERLHTGNLAVPRTALAAVGGFRSHLVRSADVELGRRLEAAGIAIVFHSEAVVRELEAPDLDEWRRSNRLFGCFDVSLAREQAAGVAPVLDRWYDRHPLNRAALALSLRSDRIARGLRSVAPRLARGAHRLGARRLSYAAFSADTNLAYWSGVRDSLRRETPLLTALRAARRG